MIIPVYVLVRDRLQSLIETLDSLQHQQAITIDIILVDNGTTYPPTLEFIKELERTGTKVIWNKGGWLDGVEEDLKSQECDVYGLTDPDVTFIRRDAIRLYYNMMLSNERIDCVGPNLKTNLLPKNEYTDEQIALQQQQFGEKPVEILHTRAYGDVKLIRAPIDTTFALRRKKNGIRRFFYDSFRVLHPYDARHLSWYLDPKNLPPDEKWYLEHADEKIATIKKHYRQHGFL